MQKGDVFLSKWGKRHTLRRMQPTLDGLLEPICESRCHRWGPMHAKDYLRVVTS